MFTSTLSGSGTTKRLVSISCMALQDKCEINTCQDLSEVASQLLLEAEMLMREIEELISCCASSNHSSQRRHTMIRQEDVEGIQEDGEALVIDGFRFESAASREELQRLSSRSRAADDARETHD